MTASDPQPPRPPSQRDLKSPYYLLRTPDGVGSFFTAENLPIVASPNEPLARFLAPARIVENGTLRSIRYDIAPPVMETARPMEFLPQSEIDGFAAAARMFYAKAHALAPRIVAHEKHLRANFRLPDPDLEPDAYWVFGPAHDRRLLIAWGAELKAGTSIVLGPDVELKIPAGRTLLDKLQSRVMTWEARQREALRFAALGTEPISRFLARPAVDRSGTPVGVSSNGRTIEAKKMRTLRRIYTSECSAFERAARAFYDRASAPESTPYEKEIRREFRLPDPDAVSGAYFVAGKKLLIVLDGKEARATTLPLVDHPVVPAAPAAAIGVAGAGDGPVVVDRRRISPGATVAEKLRERSISSARVAAVAVAAGIVLAAAGFAAWKRASDRVPPRVIESADYPAAPDERDVVVKFSKPIDPHSVQLDAAGRPSFLFGDDAARIESARVDGKDPSKVILATTPLTDGKTYRLTVDNLRDRAGYRLAGPTSVSFRYLDTVAPELKTVSAGENANQLILEFSKPLSEPSIARGSNYAIFELEGAGEGAAQRIASGHLDSEDKSGRTVTLDAVRDFVSNQPYRLESIAGVTDASVSKNSVALPAKGLDFPYRDVLPPRIRSLTASAAKLELTVTFSKPVDPAAARDLGNYAAVGPDKNALGFLPGTAALDATGRNVTLRLAPGPLALGVYRFTVRAMQDRMGNRTAGPLATAFEFADPGGYALQVVSHSIVTADNQVDNKVTLAFNRALNPDDATRAGNYALLGADRTPLDVAVVEARRVPDDSAKVILILSQAPTPGTKVIVRVAGVADIFGRKALGPIEYAFTPAGVHDPSEQVLDWLSQPVLRGNELILGIKEAVAQHSAMEAQNFVFNSGDARVQRVVGYDVRTDAKSGSRRTFLTLRVDVPSAARQGLTLRARDLRAEGLDFLGEQRLRPVDVEQP
ncbi:MAG: Ig-like domain-containing protein [Opitutaceae bacterium]|jgi:hypothetical protein